MLPRKDQEYVVNDSPRPAVLFGLATFLLFFGGFGAWAAWAPFDSAVVAPAYVRVESNSKSIQHLEGGIVKEILVADGQTVKAGDVLVRLDDTTVRAQVDILRKQFLTARAQLARLDAERENLPKVIFPEEILAQKNDSEVSKILGRELFQFKARREKLQSDTQILQQSIEQIEKQIIGTRGLLESQQEQSRLIVDELKDTQKLYENGNTTLTKLRQLQRAQALLDGQAGDYREKIAGLQVQILQTQARIVGLSVDRDDKIAAELKDVQNTLHDVEPRLEAARRTLERSELTAPVSGIVTGLTTFTIGGVIKPGEVLMQIVPQDTPLAVVAQVAVRDIEAVKPGLDAVVHLTAFKQRLTPQAHGVVTKVSADRLIEQRTGAPYFEVEVMMKPGQLTKEETANLTPGMPAEVTIPFGDRTALDYLVKPLTDSVRQAFREK